jgi:hypothetical protein
MSEQPTGTEVTVPGIDMTPLEEKKLRWHISMIKHSPENSLMREIKELKKKDLKESIQADGQLMPLLLDIRPEHKGETMGGNNTLDVLNELHTEFPDNKDFEWVWVELKTPKSDAHAFELAMKHNAKYAEYVRRGLAELIGKYKTDIQLETITVDTSSAVNLNEFLNQYNAEINPGAIQTNEAGDDSTENIVMKLSKENYEKYIAIIKQIQEAHSLNSNTDVLMFLVDEYERTKNA